MDGQGLQGTTELTQSETGLFWNEQGAVACADHAPYIGSDTWSWERWQALRIEEAQAFVTAVGSCQCETCGSSPPQLSSI